MPTAENGALSSASRGAVMEPSAAPLQRASDTSRLRAFLDAHSRVFVLTGAGCSTASGIPDYRDREGGWKGARPIQHQAFIAHEHKRKRYWARSMAGWPAVARAAPNTGHAALARLQARRQIAGLVTQNVDGLHQAAGSRGVIDLHGRLDRVVCLDCGAMHARHVVQDMLVAANPGWGRNSTVLRPDGEIDLGEIDYSAFNVPACGLCGGLLKPDVVFFGGAVPKARVARAWARLARADAVLVIGSSLMVWSGFRFVREAAARGLPIAAVNRGRSRADGLINHSFDDDCAALLQSAI